MSKFILKIGIISCLLVIIIGILFNDNNEKNRERINTQHKIEAFPVKLPTAGLEKNPEATFEILRSSAKKHSVSLINRVTNLTVEKNGSDPNLATDVVEISYFVDFENRPTLVKKFNQSTINGKSEKLFNSNVLSIIKNIATINSSDIVEGNFFLEGSEENIDRTLTDIQERYTSELNVTVAKKELYDAFSDLSVDLIPYLGIESLLGLASLFLIGCLVIYFLLIGRDSQILRMHGYTVFQISWTYLLNYINTLTVGILGIFVILNYFNDSYLISTTVFVQILVGIFILNSFIILAMKFFLTMLQSNTLNYKTYDKDFFYAIYIIKILFLVSVITNLSPLSELLRETASYSLSTLKKTDPTAEDYGIFFPLLIGRNQSDISFKSAQFFDNLSLNTQALVKDKSFIIDSSSYEQSDSLYEKVIRIDRNYLKKNPIFDPKEKQLSIEEQADRLTFLVSKHLESKIPAIKTYYQKFHATDLKTILISDRTKLTIYNGENKKLSGPFLIEVVSPKTSPPLVKGLGGADPLKLDLKQQEPKTLYTRLKPSLDEKHLSDNLITIIKLSDVNKVILLRQVGEFSIYLFQTFFSLCLAFFLIIESATAYFNQKKKLITIRRIHGYSALLAYKGFFSLLLIQSILFCLLFTLAYPSIAVGTIITCGILFIIEFATSLFTLLKIEKTNKLHVIQGG